MKDPKPEIIAVLNDLIATCRDSQEGFGKAAKGVSEELRNLFTSVSGERADFAHEVQEQVRRLGAEPEDAGHFGGILRPGWVDLEARIRPKDDGSFAAECQRGEEGTAKHYRHALEQELPPEVRAVVERQFRAVEQTIERLAASEPIQRAG
jgi:uncharacterized protein (TIGR02284 family)